MGCKSGSCKAKGKKKMEQPGSSQPSGGSQGFNKDASKSSGSTGVAAIQNAQQYQPTWKERFKNALKSAAQAGLIGAGTGFLAGGPLGALVGGGIGAIGGGAFGATAGSDKTQGGESTAADDLFWGTPEGLQMLERFDPAQREAMIQALEQGVKNVENPYSGFDAIKQDALRTFFSDVVPRLQTMFSGSGNNSVSSPILQTNISSAGAELASRLAAQQAQYGQTNKEFGLRQQELGLQPRYSGGQYTPGQPGLWSSLASNAVPQIAQTAVSRLFEPK